MKKPILVTGCPRSGTRFASRMFREVFGMMVGHETELGHGTSDWRYVDPRYKKDHFKIIFHQVRYPLDVIGSLHTITPQSMRLMEKNIVPLKGTDPLLLKCMKYYYHWVTEAERMADYSYQVENVEDKEIINKIADLVEVKPDMSAFSRLSKFENSRRDHPKYKEIIWDDLEEVDKKLYNSILEISQKYNY